MKIISGNTIEELYKNVLAECATGAKENIVVNGIFGIEQCESNFIQLYNKDAELWQRDKKPDELIINHGSYISKGGSGIDFIISELKKKRTGNRACFSLINMEDIVGSGDEVIPSFMVLQFSFSKDNPDRLLVTSYFRALEAKHFLPINLAEVCLNIKKIISNFPNIRDFELNIYAFRIQIIENFNCLRQSRLDIIEKDEMMMYLLTDRQKIINALKDKVSMVESVVVNRGLENLKSSLRLIKEQEFKNRDLVNSKIDETLNIMNELRKLRGATSIHEGQVSAKTIQVKTLLEGIIKLMEEDSK